MNVKHHEGIGLMDLTKGYQELLAAQRANHPVGYTIAWWVEDRTDHNRIFVCQRQPNGWSVGYITEPAEESDVSNRWHMFTPTGWQLYRALPAHPIATRAARAKPPSFALTSAL